MRYIIYGAGAVGGVVGGRLFQAGHDVVLIGRGPHLDALRRDGLRLRLPDEDVRLPVPAVAHPRAIAFRPDDVVVLTMKTQDTEAALRDLEAAAGTDVAVVCCQNGVENERRAARRFERVYGMVVWLPATFLEPGTVECATLPPCAVLDIGRYPTGVDDTAARIAADVGSARMLSRPRERIMRHKYAKLLTNLGNGVQAITGEWPDREAGRLLQDLLRREALACYAAAGIDYASDEEVRAEILAHLRFGPLPGRPRTGGSTWQSLMRGATTLEVDYLNGEIVLLGGLHGVPTPANALVQRIANRLAAAGEKPGRYTSAELLTMLDTVPAG
jgi:2-dehydropantoate 2-reductase